MCNFLECLELVLAWFLTPLGWAAKKKTLITVSLCSGITLLVCLLCSKALKSDVAKLWTFVGFTAYLVLSSLFHKFFSQSLRATIETFTTTFVTISWFLRSVLTLAVSVGVIFLSFFVERNLPWNFWDVLFYFAFLVHVVSTLKIYKREDFFGLAEAVFDLSLAIVLKFSKKKLGEVHYIVVIIVTFLCLMYKTRPPIVDEEEAESGGGSGASGSGASGSGTSGSGPSGSGPSGSGTEDGITVVEDDRAAESESDDDLPLFFTPATVLGDEAV